VAPTRERVVTESVRDRMRAVRDAAVVRFADRHAAVNVLNGRWAIRSLDERNHPEPYAEGGSLEELEAVVGLR